LYFIYTMVLMSAGRNSRNQASIVNRPTCGGTAKKAGTAPRVGWFLSSNTMLIGAPQSVPLFCIPNRTVQTQKTGYRATIGGNMG
jgi:hypothetical protein